MRHWTYINVSIISEWERLNQIRKNLSTGTVHRPPVMIPQPNLRPNIPMHSISPDTLFLMASQCGGAVKLPESPKIPPPPPGFGPSTRLVSQMNMNCPPPPGLQLGPMDGTAFISHCMANMPPGINSVKLPMMAPTNVSIIGKYWNYSIGFLYIYSEILK